jgi:hypothetical protein
MNTILYSIHKVYGPGFFHEDKQAEISEILRNITKLNSSNTVLLLKQALIVLNDTHLEMEMRKQINAIQLN